MAALAGLIVRALTQQPETVAADVTTFRAGFNGLHYML
jgi:hypothetical protein